MTSSRSLTVEILLKIKNDLENSIPHVNMSTIDFDPKNPRDWTIYKFGQGLGILAASQTISEYMDDIVEVENNNNNSNQIEGQISIEELLNEQQGD